MTKKLPRDMIILIVNSRKTAQLGDTKYETFYLIKEPIIVFPILSF